MAGEQETNELKALVAELSSALADMVVAIQERMGPTEEISATLVEMLQAMRDRKPDVDTAALLAALKSMRITAPDVKIVNDVHPTPIQNIVQPAEVHVQVIPAESKGGIWEVTVPGRYGAPDRVMTIKRIN